MDRSDQWYPRFLQKVFRENRGRDEVKRIVRFLATDPWFVRAVGSDGLAVNEAFVFPLVLQALVTLRAAVRWPPPPMNDDSIERLTGVPQFGRALDAAGVVKRDTDGLYDLIPVETLLPWRPDPARRARKQRHRDRKREAKLKSLGYLFRPEEPATPRTLWTADERPDSDPPLLRETGVPPQP